MVWDKKNDGCDQASFEMAWTSFLSSNRIFRYLWRGMLQENMKKKEFKFHPTQKPLSVIKWCIDWSENPNVILDPFMGSGTTGVACKELGRNFIGIEIDPNYFKIAERRIAQATQELFI